MSPGKPRSSSCSRMPLPSSWDESDLCGADIGGSNVVHMVVSTGVFADASGAEITGSSFSPVRRLLERSRLISFSRLWIFLIYCELMKSVSAS